jgi:hypothetical protein
MNKRRQNIKIEGLQKKNIFSVPENYFEKLPLEIIQKLETENPLVKEVFSKNIYQLPEGYFENLSEAINKRLQPDEIFLSEKIKTTVFSTPEGYFENLSEAINKRVQPGEIFLSEKIKTPVFTAPEGYFDKLPSLIQEKTTGKKKQIFLPEWNLQPALRYAAVASVLLIIALSGWWLFQNREYNSPGVAYENVNKPADINVLMAQLNNDDIRDYLAHHEHEDILIEAALNSKKEIHKEIEKTIPVHKREKEIIKEEIELLDSDELETGLEM